MVRTISLYTQLQVLLGIWNWNFLMIKVISSYPIILSLKTYLHQIQAVTAL